MCQLQHQILWTEPGYNFKWLDSIGGHIFWHQVLVEPVQANMLISARSWSFHEMAQAIPEVWRGYVTPETYQVISAGENQNMVTKYN